MGSYARGNARPDSDIDLVVILEDENSFMTDEKWVEHFGPINDLSWEGWGKVQCLRVYFATGMEVEFGLTGRHWLASPIDEGARDVLRQGVMVIYDPHHYVSRQFDENGIPCRLFDSGDA